MKLDGFEFSLPPSLVAQTPARPRENARLLIYDRRTNKITDDHFYNLNKYLVKDTALVLNNSKVEKCRLRFGAVEIFVLETIDPTTVRAMVKPGKKFQAGKVTEMEKLSVKTLEVAENGIRTLELSLPIDDRSLDKFRLTPFPPYIAQNEKLAEQYQTVYAKPLGSKAAPTAGLHFGKKMISELSHTHDVIYITLHVGLGTFAPLKEENIKTGRLHQEFFEVSAAAADSLNTARHITAIGTTSARTLESLGRPFSPKSSFTDIFIRPGYEFKAVDSLVTNFHLPGTSLLMLVAAFMGSVTELQRVYAHAIAKKYRFYSFGDAMLVI